MSAYSVTVIRTDINGTQVIIPNQQVSIRFRSDNGIAPIWQDEAMTIPADNPATTNNRGVIQFFAQPSEYKWVVDFGGQLIEQIFDSAASIEDVLRSYGYNPVGSWPMAGQSVNLLSRNDVIRYTDGTYFRGQGPFPQQVNQSSNPNSGFLDFSIPYNPKSVSEMSSETWPVGASIMTQGYHSPGDGGGATYLNRGQNWQVTADGFVDHSDSSGNFLELQIDDTLDIRKAGAIISSSVSSSSAIQAAVTYANQDPRSLTLYVPAGDFFIDSQISINATGNGGFYMYGDGGPRHERLGSRILTNVDGDAFLCLKDGSTFRGISLIQSSGTSQQNGYNAISMDKTNNTDDAELKIVDCNFRDYDICVDHNGRSCEVYGGEMVTCNIGVNLSWVSDGTFPARPNKTDLPFGFRDFVVSGVRAHTCNRLVRNQGLNPDFIRGVQITNNMLDLDGILFEGGLNRGVISGNVCDLNDATGTLATIKVTSGGRSISIGQNYINGHDSSGDNVETRTGATAIRFDVEANGCTINGNSISGFANNGMFFSQGINGTAIVGNAMNDCTNGIEIDGSMADSQLMNTYSNCNSNNNFSGVSVTQNSMVVSNGSIESLENASWTPSFAQLSSVNYVSRVGRETRVGDLVFLDFEIEYNSADVSDGSGIRIGGIPETIDGAGLAMATLDIVGTTGISFSASDTVQFSSGTSTSTIGVVNNAGSPYKYNGGEFQSSGVVKGVLTYRI